MALGRKALFETIRTIDSATFTGSYQNLGTQLTNAGVLVKIINNSNVIVTLSYDGTNDNDVVPDSSFTLYDFGSDAQSSSGENALSFPAKTQVRIKGAAGVGSVYLVVVYQGG